MSRWLHLLPLVAVLAPQDAWALKPSKHRELAEKACAAAGLPNAFCRRAGKEVFETDFKEWKDLSAHAQREHGQDRCSAADAALGRVDRLARSVVALARAGKLEDAAIDLGRVVHTIQDECAHHGMTNEEHAFLSMTMTCTGDQVSPDIQPAAIACAKTRTTDAMTMVSTALEGTSWNGVDRMCVDFDNRDNCQQAALPSPFMACNFLAEHKEWDGADSSWDPTIVGDSLIAALAAGLAGEQATRSVCGGDLTAIDPGNPHAQVDDRKVGCTLLDIACLGKTDEDGPPSDEPEQGGCSSSSPTGFALLFGLMLLIPRRRR